MHTIATLLIWNVFLAAAIAVGVALAGLTRFLRERPALRHNLWLLVLCKLVTPPLVPLPVLPAAAADVAETAERSEAATGLLASSATYDFEVARVDDGSARERVLNNQEAIAVASADEPFGDDSYEANTMAATGGGDATRSGARAETVTNARPLMFEDRIRHVATEIGLLTVMWVFSLVVTLVVLCRTLLQLRKLSLLLRRGDWERSRFAIIAEREAKRMRVIRSPHVCVVKARITPLLWLRGGRPVIVLPESLVSTLDEEQIACVIRHELAHYVRRDHGSNAVACFVGALFWWNPVVWWARQELRIAQESCCDALVIDGAATLRRSYAETLLQVIDFVGCERQSPTFVSGFGESFSIKRRFEMIANENVTHGMSPLARLLVAAMLLAACCYPVLGQVSTENELPSPPEHKPADADNSDAVEDAVDGADNAGDATKPKDRQTRPINPKEFELESPALPVADLQFTNPGDGSSNAVVVILADRFPVDKVSQLLRDLSKSKTLTAQVLTTEQADDPQSTMVRIESEPISHDGIGAIAVTLQKHLALITATTEGVAHQLKSYPLEVADKTETAKIATEMQLPNVNVWPDAKENRVVVMAPPEQHKTIAAAIERFDRRTSNASVESDTSLSALSTSTVRASSDTNNPREFTVEFHWKPRPLADVRFDVAQDQEQRFATILLERISKTQVPELLAAFSKDNVRFSRVTEEGVADNAALSSVRLQTETFSPESLPDVIASLKKHLTLKQMITSFPLLGKQGDGTNVLVHADPLAALSDDKTNAARSEFLAAIAEALPADSDAAGWHVHLRGVHAGSASENAAKQSAPSRSPDSQSASGAKTARATISVETPADGTPIHVRYYPLEHVDQAEAARTINALKLQHVNVLQDPDRSQLVVSAPTEADQAIAALIRELDRKPTLPTREGNPSVGNVANNRFASQARPKVGYGGSGRRANQPTLLGGEWRVISQQHGLDADPQKPDFDDYRWRFDRGTVSTEWKSNGVRGGERNRYTVDVSKSPFGLTIYGDNTLIQAIVQRDGDQLTIAHFGRSTVSRPVSFMDTREDVGPLVITQLERVATPATTGNTGSGRATDPLGGFNATPGSDRGGRPIGRPGPVTKPVNPSGKQKAEHGVKVFPLKFADADATAKLLTSMGVSETGVVVEVDRITNRLLTKGTAGQLAELSALIAELDAKTTPQSMALLPIRNVGAKAAALIIRKTFGADDEGSNITVDVGVDKLIVRGASEAQMRQIRNLLVGLEYLAELKE